MSLDGINAAEKKVKHLLEVMTERGTLYVYDVRTGGKGRPKKHVSRYPQSAADGKEL